jgi:hypothetical protein
MLQHIALTVASKKLIALAAAGALAASAAVYSQSDFSGSLGGGADLGWRQSSSPITAEVSLQGLLPTSTNAVISSVGVDAGLDAALR